MDWISKPQLILDIGSDKQAKIKNPIFSLAMEEQNQIFSQGQWILFV